MTVVFRPTIAADLVTFFTVPLPCRIKAQTALIDDRVVGVGGIAWLPDGTVAAFAALTDELREHKFALHRAVLRGLKEARRDGIIRIVAEAQAGNEAAERWLERLGFSMVELRDRKAWVWGLCSTASLKNIA